MVSPVISGFVSKVNNVQKYLCMHVEKRPWWLTTGKTEKEYSWHAPAIKFIGMKQLV